MVCGVEKCRIHSILLIIYSPFVFLRSNKKKEMKSKNIRIFNNKLERKLWNKTSKENKSGFISSKLTGVA